MEPGRRVSRRPAPCSQSPSAISLEAGPVGTERSNQGLGVLGEPMRRSGRGVQTLHQIFPRNAAADSGVLSSRFRGARESGGEAGRSWGSGPRSQPPGDGRRLHLGRNRAGQGCLMGELGSRSGRRNRAHRPPSHSEPSTCVSEGTLHAPICPPVCSISLFRVRCSHVGLPLDDPGIFSDSFGGDNAADEGQARKSQLQRRFKEFLQYRVGTDRTGFTFKYRCVPERDKRGDVVPAVLSSTRRDPAPHGVWFCTFHILS